MADLEIIHSFVKGSVKMSSVFYTKSFQRFHLLLKSGCDVILANKIFNDNLILFIEKVESPDFDCISKLTIFLYGINRSLVISAARFCFLLNTFIIFGLNIPFYKL